MRRRSFLRPLAPFTPPASFAADAPSVPGDLSLVRVSRPAMATTFEVALPFGTPDAVAAAEDALDAIDAVEELLTVYRESSEVSRLNAVAAEALTPVSAELFDLLVRCADLTRDTAGGFDVAAGALVTCWGFHKREGRIPPPAELAAARENSGTRHVMLDGRTRSVKYRRAGLALNFGGVGKGYALDVAAERLRRTWGIQSALLHGGGSSVYAIGAPPGQPRGWPVAVKHPSGRGRLGTVHLRDQGLGTSAATYQYFVYNNRKYGHVLDPRTGAPAGGTESVSVLAPTAAVADALSTALFVRGLQAARDLLGPRPELSALILSTSSPDAVTITSHPRNV